jgi:DNA repair protein RecO (recombination protein O)
VNGLQTKGIILSRTDFGEADRIITVLTPDHGKLRLMAKGVRKPKSKLAGGIELFSVSDLTFIRGRGEIGTLISSRLDKYYDHIVKDIERVQLGYDLIKLINKATEDEPEPEYFETLQNVLQALNDKDISQTLIRSWFSAQLLKLGGHSPNLKTTAVGRKLEQDTNYNFDAEAMAFTPHEKAPFTANHIKTLRLLFSTHTPEDIYKVQNISGLVTDTSPLIRTMLSEHIRV